MPSPADNINHCSFCGKHKDQIGKLIVSHKVAICNECVDLCQGLLQGKNKEQKKTSSQSEVLDPQDICDYLDQHVVGQDQAKRVLSVAVVNHFKRISSPDSHVQKSNILIIGPTGTGKTLLAKTVAEYLDVPFVIADATCLTEAGYVGDDVESMIARLYTAANNNVEACQRGIVFLDEIDKISRKSENATVARDVSGEGVQQALLKLIEGTRCKISASGGRKNGTSDTVEIDTTNILFIAGGAFVGLDSIIKHRMQGSGMGFGAQINTALEINSNDIVPDDLVKYGMIPEFVGRFGNTLSLHSLTKQQLINILTEVNHNFVSQYKWLFKQDGVELEFDKESLELIAERTMTTKTGARGLHSELERILMCHMFDLPRYKKANILRVAINKTQVNTPMTLAQENL
jgi:ATP-dependent Clp protease ATP-binding subunit ClpX